MKAACCQLTTRFGGAPSAEDFDLDPKSRAAVLSHRRDGSFSCASDGGQADATAWASISTPSVFRTIPRIATKCPSPDCHRWIAFGANSSRAWRSRLRDARTLGRVHQVAKYESALCGSPLRNNGPLIERALANAGSSLHALLRSLEFSWQRRSPLGFGPWAAACLTGISVHDAFVRSTSCGAVSSCRRPGG